jgi:ribonuclease BN (tRNA processing enzyme)
MRLTTVGTGTAAPSARRVNAGHLLETGDVRLLLDCGSGVAHRMAGLGLDWLRVTHIALTHFHLDHILDLPTLFYAWRYGVLEPRRAPVTLIGPPGVAALLDRFDALIGAAPRLTTLGFEVHVLEMEPGGAALRLPGGAELSAVKVPHTGESVAYSVRQHGRRVVYTGDTGPDQALGEWAAGCDLLLAECSLPAALAVPAHLTPETCGALAAAAQPARLVLTHFFPPVEEVPVHEIVAAQYGGECILAHDGWSIEIGPEDGT